MLVHLLTKQRYQIQKKKRIQCEQTTVDGT